MKSIDPWDFVTVSPSGDVFYPGNVYEHPFYQEIPSWIHYGEDNGTTRQLFDGAFIGADYAGAGMSNTGGITFKKELDAQQVLHVEICADGKCYRTAMDLAPAITLVMDKLAKWHIERHAPTDQKLVVGAVEAAIGEAGDALVATLVDRHRRSNRVAVGDIFGDIGSALSGAANAVGGLLKGLKGPISAAAGAAATAYGGPAAGPLAAQLAGSLVDSAPGGHPATRAAAHKTVAAAKQAAQTNPTVQIALDAANHATSQTTTAALGHPAISATQGSLSAAVQKFLPLAVKAATGQGDGGGDSLPSDLQGALSAFGGLFGGGGGTVASGAEAYYAARPVTTVRSVTTRPVTTTVRPVTTRPVATTPIRPRPVVRPTVIPRSPATPARGTSVARVSPPASHRRYNDYNFVEGWGWWPTWFPYWDSSWYSYWSYLYDYYGGDANPDYAEYARDAAMRQMAAQQGWLGGDVVNGWYDLVGSVIGACPCAH